jgi:maltose O-acetyltransferase
MSVKLFLYDKLSGMVPETRFYRFKSRMLQRCGFKVHPSARIVSSARFIGSFDLSVGEDTFIGHDVLVAGGNCKIFIGDACDLAPRASLVGGTHEIDMGGAHTAGKGYSRDIIIEDGAWIGANVTVLGGVRIGRKSVIAAGSTVTQDIPPYSLAAGIPCRVLKTWDVNRQCWIQAEKDQP